MTRRKILAAAAGAGLPLSYGSAVFAQGGNKLPVRKAKTTKLFRVRKDFQRHIV